MAKLKETMDSKLCGYTAPNIDETTLELLDPHVLLLGAGATLAAIPKGDKNGIFSKSMNGLSTIPDINEILIKHGYKPNEASNFEAFYSDLHESEENRNICNEIENAIFKYFEKLELPDEPTLYDYLILSLTSKDYIATFNWDPLLSQAYERNKVVGNLPKLLFLHGNVEQKNLLYPVKNKNYNKDIFIHDQWEQLKSALKKSVMITIFGYSAPDTDIEACNMIMEMVNYNSKKKIIDVTIIDLKKEKEIIFNWKKVVPLKFFTACKKIEDTYLWYNVRNSGEAYVNATLQQDPQKNIIYSNYSTLTELQEFVKQINIEKIRIPHYEPNITEQIDYDELPF